METGIMKQENNDLAITTDNYQIQLSPEARDAVIQLGTAIIGKAIDAGTEKFISMVRGEVEIQISAMAETVTGQKNVLDMHERNQHDLLVNYTSTREFYIRAITESTTPEEKAGYMRILESVEEGLKTAYIKNNDSLDKSLEHTKQRPKGIIGQFISRLGF